MIQGLKIVARYGYELGKIVLKIVFGRIIVMCADCRQKQKFRRRCEKCGSERLILIS